MGNRRRDRVDHRLGLLRQRIAAEAARLVLDQGVRNLAVARHKAAERLAAGHPLALPSLAEVEEEIHRRLRLFAPAERASWLAERRRRALEAMRFFARFEPRLLGALLDGTADRHSAICLHVFTDDPTEVMAWMREHGIPWQEDVRRLRIDRQREADFPVFRFFAGDDPVDVTVLPLRWLHQPPLERGGERPLPRASLATVERLLGSGAEDWLQR
ncbi:MAG: hypothetical protein KatS3mg125_0944 [Lysobacterales bacterium]|jgi:hypothetical protein|nr:MAG: hypothetical protein KatS3mg125_0944 [Xanthomonadales bacterium]